MSISKEDQSGTFQLHLRLFGGFAAQRNDGTPLQSFRSRKGQWLLCLLALRADRETDRLRVAEILWPDSDSEQALFNLRRNLVDLRRLIGPGHEEILQAPTPRTLRLSSETVFCDVRAFDTALRRDNREGLLQATALYRGAVLPECYEEWVSAERDWREEAFLSALERLADLHVAAGEWREAAECLRRALREAPTREPTLRSLMRVLADSGDRNGVTQAYESFRDRLRRELGSEVTPDEETTSLYDALRQPPNSLRRGAAALPPADQSRASTPPVSFPTVSVLPRALTPLIGRTAEREALLTSLRSSRLVTLTGTGGAGKTRLALAAGAEAEGSFDHGVHFFNLAPLIVPDVLAAALTAALIGRHAAEASKAFEQQGSAESCLVYTLRHRNQLLIWDNCEHLIDEAAHLAQLLLRACPGLHLLLTSRQSLGLPGEVIQHVTPLPAGDAARLFVERARAASGGRFVSLPDDPRVLQVCRSVEGVPLAVEMAAAWVGVLSLAEIAARLQDNLRLLLPANASESKRRQYQPPRRQTLETVLEGSFRLLDLAETRLLLRLSCFTGGWTLRDAAGLTGQDATETLGLLAQLMDKSLLYRDSDAAGADETRYNMLEIVRQYVSDRLLQQEGSAAVADLYRRHRDLFLQLAEDARPHLSGGPEQTTWLRRLDGEQGNLRAALLYCRERSEQGETHSAEFGLRLASALAPFWTVRGFLSEGLGWLEETIAVQGVDKDGAAYSEACREACALATLRGDMDTAIRHAETALGSYVRRGDVSGQAATLVRLGDINISLGRYEAAAEHLEQALLLQQGASDFTGEAETRTQWAYLLREQGEFEQARALLTEGIRLYRKQGNKIGEAAALGSLSVQLAMQGEVEAARAQLEQALSIYRGIGLRAGQSWCLATLSGWAREQDHLSEALTLVQEALAINDEIGNRGGVAWNLTTLSDLLRRDGDLPAAQDAGEQALRTASEAGAHNQEPWIYLGLSGIAHDRGDAVGALGHGRAALSLARDLGHAYTQVEVLEHIATVLWADGRTLVAARLWGAATAERERLQTPLTDLRAGTLAGRERAQADASDAWTMGATAAFEQSVQLTLDELSGV